MRYVLIVGGKMNNKGAEAMTFTMIDHIKKICRKKR